jgi:site-specific recombinase XerD
MPKPILLTEALTPPPTWSGRTRDLAGQYPQPQHARGLCARGETVPRLMRGRDLELHDIDALTVAAYIEQLGSHTAKPTVKQHLAAIKQLFANLTRCGILEVNSGRLGARPEYVTKRGKTLVLSAAEARQLLDSIESDTLIGLRDRR